MFKSRCSFSRPSSSPRGNPARLRKATAVAVLPGEDEGPHHDIIVAVGTFVAYARNLT
jgi:hypothetical protein